jgi:mono/diheme cytochrome c family protein
VVLAIVAVVGAWLFYYGMYSGASVTEVRLRPYDTAVVALGKSVYTEHCASCHGENLQGQPNWQQRNADGRLPAPPHDQSGHTWHHASANLFQVTKYGVQSVAGPDYKSDMPAYEGILSDDEIIAVLSYIKSTWPPAIRERHDGLDPR